MGNSAQEEGVAEVANRFETVATLRELDFGPVYLASDLKTQASLRSLRVYVDLAKIPHSMLNEEELAELRKNIVTLRNHGNPHLLRVYETLPEKQHELISLEHVEAVPLSALLGRCTLTVSEIVVILLETATALEALAKLGFQPFGVNPEQILVLRDGSIKVDPIGAALIRSSATDRFPALKNRYLAPESAKTLSHSNDQFVLGTLGVELLFGRKLLLDRGIKSRRINALWSVIRSKIFNFSPPPDALMNTLDTLRADLPEVRFPSISDAKHSLAWVQAELGQEPPVMPKIFERYCAVRTGNTAKRTGIGRSKPVNDDLASGREPKPRAESIPAKNESASSQVSNKRNATMFVFLMAIYVLGLLMSLPVLSSLVSLPVGQ